jgi:uncharacterized protein
VAIETHQISLLTGDGLRLAADLCTPPGARLGVAICHPHPQYGGDRHNPVVDTLFVSLAEAGIAVVRFDFRGVNDSEGVRGSGDAERLDAFAALETLSSVIDAPLWLAGYSFGAAVALDVVHERLEGWLVVAPPLAMMPGHRAAATDARPKHVIVGGHDQFSPPDATATAMSDWPNVRTTVVARADHFFAGDLATIAAWALEALGGRTGLTPEE